MPPAPVINGPVFSKLCWPPVVSGVAARAKLDPMKAKVCPAKTRAKKGQLYYNYYYYKFELWVAKFEL